MYILQTKEQVRKLVHMQVHITGEFTILTLRPIFLPLNFLYTFDIKETLNIFQRSVVHDVIILCILLQSPTSYA